MTQIVEDGRCALSRGSDFNVDQSLQFGLVFWREGTATVPSFAPPCHEFGQPPLLLEVEELVWTMPLDDDQRATLVVRQFRRQGIEGGSRCPSHDLMFTGNGAIPHFAAGERLWDDGNFHSANLTAGT